MKKCLVIYNPNSGKFRKDKKLPGFEKMLNNYGYECKIVLTEYKGHTIDIIKNAEHVDLVISIGGDGTFNEAVTGNFMRKDKLLLSHIPSGTTNDVSKMYGYTKNTLNNLKITLEGEKKRIDICLINDKPFVYSAGFGKFMNVPYETPRELKKKWGYLAYLSRGLKSYRSKTTPIDITYSVNGETYRGLFSFMIATSANRIAGINNFYKDVKLDDDRFEVLICNITSKKDIIKSLYFLTIYDATRVPGFYFYKTDKFKIKFNTPLKKPWCIDGEELDDIEEEYTITTTKEIDVLMPKKNIKNLFIKGN